MGLWKSAFILCVVVIMLSHFTEYLRPSYVVHESGIVLITGSSSGIGKSATVKMLNEGYVVVAGVRKQSDAESLKHEINENPHRKNLHPIILDVTENTDVEAALTYAESLVIQLGVPFAGLVCNAGVSPGALLPFEYSTVESERLTFDVNYFGVSNIVRLFLPLIREHKGRIAIVGSVAGNIARFFIIY
jgi:NADP-dependent 3-hydroxy acid dehydrogenase YdfG